MQGTTLHLSLPMTLKLQELVAVICPHRALALMPDAFWGDPLVSTNTALSMTNRAQRGRPPPRSTKAALEGLIKDLAFKTHDGHNPYCFMHTVSQVRSCFVARFITPNRIRTARRGRGED